MAQAAKKQMQSPQMLCLGQLWRRLRLACAGHATRIYTDIDTNKLQTRVSRREGSLQRPHPPYNAGGGEYFPQIDLNDQDT